MGRTWAAWLCGAALLLALPLSARAGMPAAEAGAAAVPETPQFRRLGVADGLPSGRTNALVQDRAGYLWVATDDGLARYDGVEFRVWRYNPGIVNGMPGNAVQALLVDREDAVWMAISDGGLVRLAPNRRDLDVFDAKRLPGIGEADIWSVAQTPDGTIWASTFGAGLYRGDAARGFTQMPTVATGALGEAQDTVLGLAVDGEGVLWAGTLSGLARIVDGRVEPVAAGALDAQAIVWLSPASDGGLWIGTRFDQLWRRTPEGRFERSPWNAALQPDTRVHGVLDDGIGGQWLHTSRGLYRVDERGVRGYRTPEAAEGDYQQGLIDRQGGLWFGETDAGLVWLSGYWRSFGLLSRQGDPALRLSMRVPQSLGAAPRGGIWIGGEEGRIDLLSADGQQVARHVLPAAATDGGRVVAIDDDGEGGALWLGSSRGLARRAPDGRWQRWGPGDGPDAALSGSADLIARMPDGTRWISFYGGGMQHRDAEGRVLRTVTRESGLGLESPWNEVLVAGPDGALWVGNGQGILRWNGTRFDVLASPEPAPVQGLAFAADGTLWAWHPGQLEQYRWTGSALELLSRADSGNDGLPAAEAGGLAIDRSGRVWITSVRGLVRWDPRTRSARIFGPGDGLVDREMGLRSPLVLADGRIAATTATGAVVFDPARIEADAQVPRLVVESISVRRAEDVVELDAGERIELQPADRDLRVVARLMSFADPGAHRYRFRLNGYDPDWVDVGASGERLLPRQVPGQYTLDLMAAGADGRWSPPQRLLIVVHPPWYLSTWALVAWTLCGLGLLGVAAWLYRSRIEAAAERRREAQARELAQQASEAKSVFLADLGHELRTPLTGVLGMAELMLGGELDGVQRGRAETVQRAGQHLLRLVNDTLDLARIEAGKLRLEDEPFAPALLLAEVAQLLRPLAEAKGLGFAMRIAPGVAPRLRGDAARLRQVLLNLGGNAIKFTEQGEVRLQAGPRDGGGLVLEVADTGIGLDAEQQRRLFQRFEQAEGEDTRRRYGGSGLGLAISRELVRAMGGELRLDSRKGEGSRFSAELPLVELEADGAAPPPPAVAGDTRVLSLLLVEDDAVVADVVRGLLEAQGHRVHHAGQALQALTLLQTERVDLAFLDLDLPAVDGIELARVIRGNGWTLPLLALTARADAGSERAALAAGMDGYLRKPVDGATLAATLAPFARVG